MLLYILDDDITELAFWADTIRRLNPEITFELFSDCSAFKASFIAKQPDACILDMILPFHPGTEVCAWLKEVAEHVPVFVNTCLEGDEYKILAERCHATYMCKHTMTFEERLEVVVNGCKS